MFQTNAAYRYQYMPPADPALMAAPHLSVFYGSDLSPRDGMTPLGVVTRDANDGTVLQSFAVYLANG